MTFDDFQLASLRTSRAEPHDERLMVQTLGLCGEAGEVAQLIKKWMWHGKPLNAATVADELGDCLWYISDLASACGLSLDDIAAQNVRKLEARYPGGFTPDGGIR